MLHVLNTETKIFKLYFINILSISVSLGTEMEDVITRKPYLTYQFTNGI